RASFRRLRCATDGGDAVSRTGCRPRAAPGRIRRDPAAHRQAVGAMIGADRPEQPGWRPLVESIGAWLDRRHIGQCCAVLLALEAAVFLFIVAGTHGWMVPLERPTTTDFASFYAAGVLANAGTPELVYDQAAHFA